MLSVVSVITVNLNNSDGLEKTIKSVVGQTYKPIEFIIIDGASHDRSVEVIRSYEDNITKWISEPDDGVYDAMNKGLGLASGDWVIFMNSGDAFYDDAVLGYVFNREYDRDLVAIYGDVNLCFRQGGVIRELRPIDDQMPSICHQSLFIRLSEFKRKRFDTRYSLCADYEFLQNLYRSGSKFKYINTTIANYDMRGVSAQRLDLYYKEMASIEGNYSKIVFFKYKAKTVFRRFFPGLFDALFYWVLKRRYAKM